MSKREVFEELERAKAKRARYDGLHAVRPRPIEQLVRELERRALEDLAAPVPPARRRGA